MGLGERRILCSISLPGKGKEMSAMQAIFILIIIFCALVTEKWVVMKSPWCALFFDSRLAIGNSL